MSESAAACPHCGCPNPKKAADRKAGKIDIDVSSLFNSGPKCPLCGSAMTKKSAGTLFGGGNLIKAFTSSGLQCISCGHIE